jgi:hypothetical protein
LLHNFYGMFYSEIDYIKEAGYPWLVAWLLAEHARLCPHSSRQ